MYLCYISPSKPAAQSLGSVCHTILHKRLDLYSSWCSKCAVIAQSHMHSGVFRVSHHIYSSTIHVIMMPALAQHHHHFPIFRPFACVIRVIVIKPHSLPAWKYLTALLEMLLYCDLMGHQQQASQK